MSDPNSEAPEMSGELAAQSGIGRRRLLRAGLAVTPVILVTSGRSAFAQNSNCGSGLSPMAFLSAFPNGNCNAPAALSHTPGRSSALGLSPGYWTPNTGGNSKTFQGPWPVGIYPFLTLNTDPPTTWNSEIYRDYRGLPADINGQDAGWNTGTKLAWLDANRSISRILIEENASYGLKWHVCAAYLNAVMSEQAGLSGSGGYALTSEEVRNIYLSRTLNGSSVVGDDVLKSFFDQTWA